MRMPPVPKRMATGSLGIFEPCSLTARSPNSAGWRVFRSAGTQVASASISNGRPSRRSSQHIRLAPSSSLAIMRSARSTFRRDISGGRLASCMRSSLVSRDPIAPCQTPPTMRANSEGGDRSAGSGTSDPRDYRSRGCASAQMQAAWRNCHVTSPDKAPFS